MDENTTGLTTAEEMADETSAAFDEGWEDKDEPELRDDGYGDGEDFEDEPETDEGSGETEADADQQEAEEPEGGETGEEAEAEEQGDEGEPNQAESFILKHLGEERKVGRDEVVTLAQKGLDYDRIREKWDGVKDDVQRLRMYEDFLGELAKARGGDGDIVDEINALIDETRIRTMLAKAEADGTELSPAAAAARAVKARTDFLPANTPAQDTEEARQEKVREDIVRFREGYPDVKMEEIPQEVWNAVDRNGGDLLGCYQRYENQKLKEELKNLKKELEGQTQQKKNKARSTGSTKSVGTGTKRDAFEEGWDWDR